MTKPGRHRDTNLLAKSIVDLATGEIEDENPDEGKDLAAVALGRKGGQKGGKARAAKMTPEERSEAARKAAKARWEKANEQSEETSEVGSSASGSKRHGVIQTPKE